MQRNKNKEAIRNKGFALIYKAFQVSLTSLRKKAEEGDILSARALFILQQELNDISPRVSDNAAQKYLCELNLFTYYCQDPSLNNLVREALDLHAKGKLEVKEEEQIEGRQE